MDLSVLIEALPPTGPGNFVHPVHPPYLQDVSYGRTHRVARPPADLEGWEEPATAKKAGATTPLDKERDRFREAWNAFMDYVDPHHRLYSRATLHELETEVRSRLVAFVSEEAVQAMLGKKTSRDAIAALSGSRTAASLGAIEALFRFLEKK